jgi:hypothetical protein
MVLILFAVQAQAFIHHDLRKFHSQNLGEFLYLKGMGLAMLSKQSLRSHELIN